MARFLLLFKLAARLGEIVLLLFQLRLVARNLRVHPLELLQWHRRGWDGEEANGAGEGRRQGTPT